jgi:signal transduction histidine kinase
MERLASLGRMSAGIAHEVRNPLTGVSLLLDELHDRLLGQERDQQLIRRALEEIERLDGLVNEMLCFASMPAPKLLNGSVIDVLHNSLFLVRKQCQRSGIKIVEQVSGDLPNIQLDTDRLKQVFLNLFNNAIDAMPDGGELLVGAELIENHIHVWVKDSGVGINTEQLPFIFEPFYTSKGQGTGLGLAISYNIITDHGGEIALESTSGEGTQINLKLPLNLDA